MKELEEVLNNRWIIKNKDKNKYYRVKDKLEEIKRFVTDKMGCQLIVNSHLIKVEKIPAKAESSMGILEFNSAMEYSFLCLILAFLEDKEEQEQFVLSQLTEFIETALPEQKVDWTIFTNRRQLVKVIRFCIANDFLQINDGDDESFVNSDSGEVLYENTGISRYFMRNFTRDMMKYNAVEDFENSDWQDVNEDRGIARRHRVYKRLILSSGMLRESAQDEDFEYLKYYGNRMNEELSTLFDCQLQVYKSSAYLLMGGDGHLGKPFPDKRNNLSDITLLCNRYFLKKIQSGEWKKTVNETVQISKILFERELLACRNKEGAGFTKRYREELTSSEFVQVVSTYMEQIGFIERTSAEITLKPMVGMILGKYPADYNDKETKERKVKKNVK